MLVANRGEIAVRIIKTLRRLHIASVAVFADNDAEALHRRLADEAYPLGDGMLKDTYLNIQKIIDAALDSGADAIHPGYGFLSENPELAEACASNNLIFIGPDAEVIRLMGNKIAARNIAIKEGIPVTFGLTGSNTMTHILMTGTRDWLNLVGLFVITLLSTTVILMNIVMTITEILFICMNVSVPYNAVIRKSSRSRRRQP